MLSLADLPFLNALFNSTSTLLLVTGYVLIRNRRKSAHKKCMVAALVTTALFLSSYLVYHFNVGSVPFPGEGMIRTVYFSVLIPHTLLAMTLPVLVPITLVRALRERFDKHRSIARVTLPIWLFVSVTGVIIYVMLYRMFPVGQILD